MIRDILGQLAITPGSNIGFADLGTASSALFGLADTAGYGSTAFVASAPYKSLYVRLRAGRAVPVGNANKPRAVMVHPCAYVGGGQ